MRMNINDLSKLNFDLKRVEKVIKSCETKEQFENAITYSGLMQTFYWNTFFKGSITAMASNDCYMVRKEFKRIHEESKLKLKNILTLNK